MHIAHTLIGRSIGKIGDLRIYLKINMFLFSVAAIWLLFRDSKVAVTLQKTFQVDYSHLYVRILCTKGGHVFATNLYRREPNVGQPLSLKQGS